MRYVDGLLSLSVISLKSVGFCDRILCKTHKVGEGCIRFVG